MNRQTWGHIFVVWLRSKIHAWRLYWSYRIPCFRIMPSFAIGCYLGYMDDQKALKVLLQNKPTGCNSNGFIHFLHQHKFTVIMVRSQETAYDTTRDYNEEEKDYGCRRTSMTEHLCLCPRFGFIDHSVGYSGKDRRYREGDLEDSKEQG